MVQTGYKPNRKAKRRRARRFAQWAAQMRSPDPEVRRQAEEQLRKGQDFQRRRGGTCLKRLEVAQAAGVDPEDLLAYEWGQLPSEECNPSDFVERIEAALKSLADQILLTRYPLALACLPVIVIGEAWWFFEGKIRGWETD